MKQSELKELIREELKNLVSENSNMGEKHISQIHSILDTLFSIYGELDEEYYGWGTEDIKRLLGESMKALSKLPRLITKNTQ